MEMVSAKRQRGRPRKKRRNIKQKATGDMERNGSIRTHPYGLMFIYNHCSYKEAEREVHETKTTECTNDVWGTATG